MFITPITPYLLCDYYLATEVSITDGCVPEYAHNLIHSHDLFNIDNIKNIKEYDVIAVQVYYLPHFYNKILPLLKVKIILFTCQWRSPGIIKTDFTDKLLKHDLIALWVSQNPVYTNEEKYMAFPYGIRQHDLNNIVSIRERCEPIFKTKELFNAPGGVHRHLEYDHIRRSHKLFSLPRINFGEYFCRLSEAKYTISTGGDRDDTYRHYECIYFKSKPISNIQYKEIFGDNMIYSTREEMLEMIMSETVSFEYKQPDENLIKIDFWKNKLSQRVFESMR